jgi:hypothetical protein
MILLFLDSLLHDSSGIDHAAHAITQLPIHCPSRVAGSIFYLLWLCFAAEGLEGLSSAVLNLARKCTEDKGR